MTDHRLGLPAHWTFNRQTGTATRSDGVRVLHQGSKYVVENDGGMRVLTQRTRNGSRARLFRYLSGAVESADKAWPLTSEELDREAAFRLVANPTDWKAPIDARVPADKLVAVVRAIAFYTATSATVTPEGDVFRVTSIGYRSGPAGDH